MRYLQNSDLFKIVSMQCGVRWLKCKQHLHKRPDECHRTLGRRTVKNSDEKVINKPYPKRRKCGEHEEAAARGLQANRRRIELQLGTKLANKLPHLVRKSGEEGILRKPLCL